MIPLPDFFSYPLSNKPSPVEDRQHRQWQMANDMLNSATLSIDAGNTDQATALALMGLLALKLSDS